MGSRSGIRSTIDVHHGAQPSGPRLSRGPPRPRRSFTEGSIRIFRGTIDSVGRAGAPVWGRSAAAARCAVSSPRAVAGGWVCALPTCLRAATSSDIRKRLPRKNLSRPPRFSEVGSAAGLSAPCCSSSSLVGIRCLRSSRVITTSPMRTLRVRSLPSCRRAAPG